MFAHLYITLLPLLTAHQSHLSEKAFRFKVRGRPLPFHVLELYIIIIFALNITFGALWTYQRYFYSFTPLLSSLKIPMIIFKRNTSEDHNIPNESV